MRTCLIKTAGVAEAEALLARMRANRVQPVASVHASILGALRRRSRAACSATESSTSSNIEWKNSSNDINSSSSSSSSSSATSSSSSSSDSSSSSSASSSDDLEDDDVDSDVTAGASPVSATACTGTSTAANAIEHNVLVRMLLSAPRSEVQQSASPWNVSDSPPKPLANRWQTVEPIRRKISSCSAVCVTNHRATKLTAATFRCCRLR
jgi:hypothetical protein